MEFENRIICGDNMEVMAGLADNSIDTIITDPPYGLGFMGKEWDTFKPKEIEIKTKEGRTSRKICVSRLGNKKRLESMTGISSAATNAGLYDHSRNAEFQQWFTLWAKEVLRIAKPGAMMLIFGGTRTYHRLTCAIEDAGWQIRDCIMWLYGSGFPKSHDISKAIDKTSIIICPECEGNGGKQHPDNKNAKRWEDWKPDIPCEKCKGTGKIKGAEREVVGQYDRRSVQDGANRVSNGNTGNSQCAGRNNNVKITTPTTDLAQLWDGYGTAFKPAWEPIIVAMKPLDGTFAQNVEKWGVGGLWIDGGRIGINPEADASQLRTMNRSQKTEKNGWGMNQNNADKPQVVKPQGRWPANVILDEESAAMLDEQSGELTGGTGETKIYGEYHNDKRFNASKQVNRLSYKGSGGASRFFYCAKASRSERNAGLGPEEATLFSEAEKGMKENSTAFNSSGYGDGEPAKMQNNHPTVKPLALMEYLCRLTRTPSGGIVLDPFGGSGTTALACINTGRKYLLIEKEMQYCEIAKARVRSESFV